MRLALEARPGSDGWVVIAVRGELDASTTAALGQCIVDQTSHGHACLRVDLTASSFSDSSGLATLLGGLRRAEAADGTLELDGVPRRLRDILSMTGLDRTLLIRGTVTAGSRTAPGV
jgi:anti-sigma B factor antagonist